MKLVPARGLDGAFEFREFAHRAIVHIELVRSTATSFSVAAANRVSRFREESTVESAALYAEFVRTDPRDRPKTNQTASSLSESQPTRLPYPERARSHARRRSAISSRTATPRDVGQLPASSADLGRLIDGGRLGRRFDGRKSTGRCRLGEECGQLRL